MKSSTSASPSSATSTSASIHTNHSNKSNGNGNRTGNGNGTPGLMQTHTFQSPKKALDSSAQEVFEREARALQEELAMMQRTLEDRMQRYQNLTKL
jgi:hypothetical protein